jgi:quinol monooxygenase YgiN
LSRNLRSEGLKSTNRFSKTTDIETFFGVKAMSKLTIVATLEATEGSFENLLALIKQHAKRCLKREPGCLHFDIMVPREQGDQIILYEIYSDQAALDDHLTTDHMERFRKERTPYFKSAQASTCNLLEY